MTAHATPPSTLEERLKRALIPPRLELARITAREKRKGEPGLRMLPFLVDPERAAFDIGANRGIWAGEMAKLTRTVWAFEPNPKLFAVLSRAVPPSVTCRHVALSDAPGEAELLIPGEKGRFSNQGASLNPAKVEGEPFMSVKVEAAPLDALDPPPVGFMKVDVEGHEMAVLKGAANTIARDRPVMIVEAEERHTGRSLDSLLDEIEAYGYRAHPIRRGRIIARDRLDIAADHRALAGKPGYVNNFLCLPA